MYKNGLKAEQIAKAVISLLEKSNSLNLLEDIIEILKKQLVFGEKAIVITPVVLDNTQKSKIIKLVAKLVNRKEFVIDYKVDSGLIDGLQVRFKDRLWDFSLEKQISSMLKKEIG